MFSNGLPCTWTCAKHYVTHTRREAWGGREREEEEGEKEENEEGEEEREERRKMMR